MSSCIYRTAQVLPRCTKGARFFASPPTYGAESVGKIVPHGPQGRSSISGLRAVVFGASGFLARYIVDIIGGKGSYVYTGYRGEADSVRHLRVCGDIGSVQAVYTDCRDKASIKHAMARANVVINLIGKEENTLNYTITQANVETAKVIAECVKEHGNIEHFIHFSSLMADANSPSVFCRAKAEGEAIVRATCPDATIVKPSAVFGHEDRLLNLWATRMQLPNVPHSSAALDAKLQPVHSLDVAKGVFNMLTDPNTRGRTFELGGPDVLTFESVLRTIHVGTDQPDRPIRRAPALLTSATEFWSALSPPEHAGRDEALRAVQDQVVGPDALTFAHLGVDPTPMELEARELLRRFRRVPRFGMEVDETGSYIA